MQRIQHHGGACAENSSVTCSARDSLWAIRTVPVLSDLTSGGRSNSPYPVLSYGWIPTYGQSHVNVATVHLVHVDLPGEDDD